MRLSISSTSMTSSTQCIDWTLFAPQISYEFWEPPSHKICHVEATELSLKQTFCFVAFVVSVNLLPLIIMFVPSHLVTRNDYFRRYISVRFGSTIALS